MGEFAFRDAEFCGAAPRGQAWRFAPRSIRGRAPDAAKPGRIAAQGRAIQEKRRKIRAACVNFTLM